jgi:hypothetical protein
VTAQPPGWLPRILPGALAILVVLILLGTFFPKYVFHWDEVQLTLGLEQFDLRSHQPHAPGYYLFVVLGRVLKPLVASPENALRSVATLASAVFAGLLAWWLPAGLALRARLGLVAAAAAFVVCSPIVLFHSVAALAYTAEAICWLAILLAVASRPQGGRLVLLAAGIGLAGGFRQTLIVWGVIAIAIGWLRDRSWLDGRAALLLLAGLVAGVAIWSLPMLVEVGGWDEYTAASGPLLRGNIWEKSVWHEGLAPFAQRLVRMLADLWLAAGPLIVVAAAGLAVRSHPRCRERLARWDLLPIGATLAFLFYAVLIYDSDGYILAVAIPLGAYALLAPAELLAGSSTWRQVAAAAIVLVLALSLSLLPGGFASAADDRGYRLYAQHDAALDARIGVVRQSFDPATTVLVTSHEYWQWSFRHVMYYLPEYTVIQLIPDRFFVDAGPEQPYLTARDHEIRFAGPDGLDVRSLAESVRQVVYVVPHDLSLFVSPACAPFLQRISVTSSESFGVLWVTESYDVHVARAQLHCRRRS